MTTARMEPLVEPFHEGGPGRHVLAVVEAVDTSSVDVEMGPFATTVVGELADIVATVADLLAAGFAAGATAIQLRIETSDVGK